MRIFLVVFCVFSFIPIFLNGQIYRPEGSRIVGNNVDRYNNRPLYINNSDAFILTGDLPLVKLVQGKNIYGNFNIGLKRGERAKWLHDFNNIQSQFENGKMVWIISDSSYQETVIKLEVFPTHEKIGLLSKIKIEKSQKNDSIFWLYGGAEERNENLNWKFDVLGNPDLIQKDLEVISDNNRIFISENDFTIDFESLKGDVDNFSIVGTCSKINKLKICDADHWKDINKLLVCDSDNNPVVSDCVSMENVDTILWLFKLKNEDIVEDHFLAESILLEYEEGEQRIQNLNKEIRINTPDPFLNAIVKNSVHAHDGAWYPPVFVHGPMQWNYPYPGWRSIFGAIMLGWHDRVKMEAKYYIDSQVTESDKTSPKIDPKTLYTAQHADSRYYGIGRLTQDQGFYNMQTQFFDQIIEEWRWTADPELESFLRKALDLHLKWVKDCFDPDGDGIYESYINVWPSDSQWYNGGGTAEETSYAYKAHLAARDLAQRAGDMSAVLYHESMLKKIKEAFFDLLWIDKNGHSGSYREQGGYERLHKDPWLYSIFLPIDAGLTTQKKAIESLYYSEWALQNDSNDLGGRQVWTSNWVPGIWSIRELSPGDNYHLALAYFQAGLPDDGWDIMRGNFMESAFNSLVPGNLGMPSGGIDFADCKDMFLRSLVQGMFGYNPDYPNDKVIFKPQFPKSWASAEIELADFSLTFEKELLKTKYEITLDKTAKATVQIPLSVARVYDVKVDGKSVNYNKKPGIGCSIVEIEIQNCSSSKIEVTHSERLDYDPPRYIEINSGEELLLNFKNEIITQVFDPQGIFKSVNSDEDEVRVAFGSNTGYHTFIIETQIDDNPKWRVFRTKINDPQKDNDEKERYVKEIPGKCDWQVIDINDKMNADVRKIYEQQYLSPRPNTVSVRLGSDGYSPWTFYHWHSKPPSIEFNLIDPLIDNNKLQTKQGVPFHFINNDLNVVFTSLWDNYPNEIKIPIDEQGDAIWFMVIGSTNVMQCQIANAVIVVNYEDGGRDSIELIPPVNYWNLSSISTHNNAPLQDRRTYYDSEIDKFCLPEELPEIVSLGSECNAMLLNLKLRPDTKIKNVELRCLSQEIVVGIMGISIMRIQD